MQADSRPRRTRRRLTELLDDLDRELGPVDDADLAWADRALGLAVPADVVAQAWRGGPRQARVTRLLGDPAVQVIPLDDVTARAVGLLCGRSGHPDVIDVHVALHAHEHGHAVVTSDPGNLHAVDPGLHLIAV